MSGLPLGRQLRRGVRLALRSRRILSLGPASQASYDGQQQ